MEYRNRDAPSAVHDGPGRQDRAILYRISSRVARGGVLTARDYRFVHPREFVPPESKGAR